MGCLQFFQALIPNGKTCILEVHFDFLLQGTVAKACQSLEIIMALSFIGSPNQTHPARVVELDHYSREWLPVFRRTSLKPWRSNKRWVGLVVQWQGLIPLFINQWEFETSPHWACSGRQRICPGSNWANEKNRCRVNQGHLDRSTIDTCATSMHRYSGSTSTCTSKYGSFSWPHDRHMLKWWICKFQVAMKLFWLAKGIKNLQVPGASWKFSLNLNH